MNYHTASPRANLDSTYTYNSEGKITIDKLLWDWRKLWPLTPGPSYNYSYDSMYRLSVMTIRATTPWSAASATTQANRLLA